MPSRGDARHDEAAFYAYAHPAPDGIADATLAPAAARWEPTLGEFLLDHEDARATGNTPAAALALARSAFQHACVACGWDAALAATADDTAPVR